MRNVSIVIDLFNKTIEIIIYWQGLHMCTVLFLVSLSRSFHFLASNWVYKIV